jgi:hypothetical protein
MITKKIKKSKYNASYGKIPFGFSRVNKLFDSDITGKKI